MDIDDEQVSVFFGRDWVITLQERPGVVVFCTPVVNASVLAGPALIVKE